MYVFVWLGRFLCLRTLMHDTLGGQTVFFTAQTAE